MEIGGHLQIGVRRPWDQVSRKVQRNVFSSKELRKTKSGYASSVLVAVFGGPVHAAPSLIVRISDQTDEQYWAA